MGFQSLLIASDFSPESEWALKWGGSIAERYAAKLTILHVVEALSVHPHVAPEDPGAFANLFQERMLRKARAELRAVAERVAQTGVQPETMLLAGQPVDEILSAAAHTRADLLILAARSRSALARALLGGVAEKVLRNAPCNVLIVKKPSGDELPQAPRLEKILLATDFSDLSLTAIPPVRSLLKAFDASVDVFHAVPDPGHYPLMSWDLFPSIAATDYYEQATDGARETLQRKLGEHFRDVSHVEYSVGVGAAADAILAARAQGGHDLIALSTHGYSGLRRLVIGSVAERVVRLADCPVLVVSAHPRSPEG